MKITTNCKDFKYYSKINCEELKNIACRAMIILGKKVANDEIEIEDERDIPYYLNDILIEILCEYSDEENEWEIIKEYSFASNPLPLNEAMKKFVEEIAKYIDFED